MADVVAQCGGVHAFFANNNAMRDCATQVELLGQPLPILTKPRRLQYSRAEPVWPHLEDTLPMPGGLITFSNEDLCCSKPDHNRPLFVGVEH